MWRRRAVGGGAEQGWCCNVAAAGRGGGAGLGAAVGGGGGAGLGAATPDPSRAPGVLGRDGGSWWAVTRTGRGCWVVVGRSRACGAARVGWLRRRRCGGGVGG